MKRITRLLLPLTLATLLLLAVHGVARPAPSAPSPAEKRAPAAPATLLAVSAESVDEEQPAVAYQPALDGYLAVWEHAYAAGDHDIYARRVGPGGSLPGSRLPLATSTSSQHRPAVAAGAGSTFLAVWEEVYSPNPADLDLYARLLHDDSSSSQIAVATSSQVERAPAVAYDPPSDSYLVVWEQRAQGGEGSGIFGRRLSGAGAQLGGPLTIFSDTRPATAPAVVAGGNGFLVVWQVDNAESASLDIFAQFVGGDGSLGDGPLAVAGDQQDQTNPALAYNGDDDHYLLVWENANAGQYGIEGQLLNGDGSLLGGHLAVSSQSANFRMTPDAAYSSSVAEYAVAWSYEFSSNDHDVYRRRVDREGGFPEAETPVSALSSHEQRPALAAGSAQDYFLAWQDGRNSNNNGLDIYGDAFNLRSDLVLAALALVPERTYPGEGVTVSARLENSGPLPYADIPLRFSSDGLPFHTATVPYLGAGTGVTVSTPYPYTATGVFEVAAEANPAGTLPEQTLANNRLAGTLSLVWEFDPPWLRPDLLLENVHFDPHRPAFDDTVLVMADLHNLGPTAVAAAEVRLLVDGVLVDQQSFPGVEGAASRPITLAWSATPGRHFLALEADPGGLVAEQDESNNQNGAWIRVEGAADPLPDLEVDLPAPDLLPNAGESVSLTLAIRNEGYADAEGLPVSVTLDGAEIVATAFELLNAGESLELSVPWRNALPGAHRLDVWIDPHDVVADDSLQGVWSYNFFVPGPQYRLVTPDSRSGRWTPVGPTSIDGGAYVGRLDAVDVSRQDGDKLVVGATQGGVWLSHDGAATWAPVADHLDSPNFSTTRFDPRDDDVIYAGTGSALYGAGSGLYRSADNGAHWTRFIGTGIGAGFSRLVLAYTTGGDLAIFAGTRTGLWFWQGDPNTQTTETADWTQIWSGPDAARSRVTDLLLTAEPTPRLYWAASGDNVYRVAAANPAGGTVETLNGNLPASRREIMLANSPATPGRVYAAMKLIDGTGRILVYRLDGGTSWSYRGEVPAACNAANQYLHSHPQNADVLYVGAVKGCRSDDGGATFAYQIPGTVHDDYKDMAFDPAQPDTAYFVTDGGIYRCTNNRGAMSCASRSSGLATTMPFDIALAATDPTRIVAGTQDNGNIMSDGSPLWRKIARYGDGKYVAIDPAAADTIFVQYQYINSLISTTVAGGSNLDQWHDANDGLPPTTGNDPYLAMDPTDGRVLLVAEQEVYRTTNGGGDWDPIGPDPLLTGAGIKRIAIDPATNRYYAGTTNGQIWALDGNNVSRLGWTQIYTHPYRREVRDIRVDPANPAVLFASFRATGNSRVVRLARQGDWDRPWDEQRIGARLGSRALWGGYLDQVRGLVKDPHADILYVGTDRGVYQGRPDPGAADPADWTWFPDSCGLPETYVSDLALHPSGNYMAAATFGRSVYTRTMAQFNPAPDAYEAGGGNDRLQDAATIPATVTGSILLPGLLITEANLHHAHDADYYAVRLPDAAAEACLPAGDPRLGQPGVTQCAFQLLLYAADTPDPFEIRLFRPDGSLLEAQEAHASNLTYRLERPHDIFPDGQIRFAVANATGCRSQYEVGLFYNEWYAPPQSLPELNYEIDYYLPDVATFRWLFPHEAQVINESFVGATPIPIPRPAQQAVFEWPEAGQFSANLQVEGAGSVSVRLLDAAGNQVAAPVSAAGPLAAAPAAPAAPTNITVDDLPAGFYALQFEEGTFPTFFTAELAACRAAQPPLAVAVAGTTAALSWNGEAVQEAYAVHRSPTPYFNPAGETLLASLGGSATGYDDETLTAGADVFFYRVVAENCGGAQTAASGEVGLFEFGLQ